MASAPALRFDPLAVSVVPRRTDDPDEARRCLDRDGAVVVGPALFGSRTLEEMAPLLLGDDFVLGAEPVPVRSTGGNDAAAYGRTRSDAHLAPLPLHNDGFAYGDRLPDHLLLVCETPAPDGGASMLVDVDAVLAGLRATGEPDDAALARFLTEVPVDRSEKGGLRSIGPLIDVTAHGRRVLHTSFDVEPLDTDPDPTTTRAFVARWNAVLDALGDGSARFRLEAGDCLWVDNYRMLHARDGYRDQAERLLWRIWAWSTTSAGVPEGEIASDTSKLIGEDVAAERR
jgi:gamma-butyrobetaine dioxygenase